MDDGTTTTTTTNTTNPTTPTSPTSDAEPAEPRVPFAEGVLAAVTPAGGDSWQLGVKAGDRERPLTFEEIGRVIAMCGARTTCG